MHPECWGAAALVTVSSLTKILMCDLHTTEELAIFRSLLGKSMAKINLSHRSASVSCSSEGRKGLTPHWIHFCLSRVLAASVWKACIVSLFFVIRFPMVVSVTYLTLFELIKLGNQGKHISGGDLLPKDISAEGEKKEISLYVQHSWAVS